MSHVNLRVHVVHPVRGEVLQLPSREHRFHEIFRNVGGEFVAQIAAGDSAGLDGHLILHEVLVAVAALTEMELKMGALLAGEIAADVFEEEGRELPALHQRAFPKCGASRVRNA